VENRSSSRYIRRRFWRWKHRSRRFTARIPQTDIRTSPFAGKHYQLAETFNSPQPLSRPHPPIMFGGGGATKTLRLVARYGDACNLLARSDTGPAVVKAKLDVLAARYAGKAPTTTGCARRSCGPDSWSPPPPKPPVCLMAQAMVTQTLSCTRLTNKIKLRRSLPQRHVSNYHKHR
jgi:hypothetical protein